MTAIYADAWLRKYPADTELTRLAREEWRESLAKIANEKIRHGLERCRDELKFPPTIAEFREMATDGDKPKEHFEHERIKSLGEEWRQAKALPMPKPDPERVKAALNTARNTVGAGGRRNVLVGGENHTDYLRHLAEGKAKGETLYQTDMRLMARNGWTEADEEKYRHHAAAIGRSVYLPGHDQRGK